MGKTKHIINLTEKEKDYLRNVIDDTSSSERHITRARILLASDMGNSQRMTIEKITHEYQTTGPTVILTRQNYMKFGAEGAVHGKKRENPPVAPKVTPIVEAEIIHLLYSPPPQGKRKWTMRSLAKKAQEEGIIESISRTKVNRILQKYGLTTRP